MVQYLDHLGPYPSSPPKKIDGKQNLRTEKSEGATPPGERGNDRHAVRVGDRGAHHNWVLRLSNNLLEIGEVKSKSSDWTI